MMNLGKCLITDESGSTAIEYALVAAGIALTALTTLRLAPLSQAYSAGLSPTSVQRATVDQDRSSAKWGVGSQTHSVPC